MNAIKDEIIIENGLVRTIIGANAHRLAFRDGMRQVWEGNPNYKPGQYLLCGNWGVVLVEEVSSYRDGDVILTVISQSEEETC